MKEKLNKKKKEKSKSAYINSSKHLFMLTVIYSNTACTPEQNHDIDKKQNV
jgi:predicted nucleic acid-binding protein